MKFDDLKTMSVDELWLLHERVASILAVKISEEKRRLEHRLNQLGHSPAASKEPSRPRRPYPEVLPKYRNPKNPHETWAGRGKTPRWLRAQLRAGKNIEDFRISSVVRSGQSTQANGRVRSRA